MKNNNKKEKALELLQELDIYAPYIAGFKENDRVCFYENFIGFWLDQESDVLAKMQELEKDYGCLVYAVTHEYTDFGECYSFLIVTRYPEEWDTLVCKDGSTFYAFAYVWNKDDDDCSEFGTVCVRSFGGGITRVG